MSVLCLLIFFNPYCINLERNLKKGQKWCVKNLAVKRQLKYTKWLSPKWNNYKNKNFTDSRHKNYSIHFNDCKLQWFFQHFIC